jgi:DNA-binding LytR/AlgR family response regulator
MKLTCLILDDEEIAITHLSKYINKIPYLELIACFTNPKQAIDYLQENEVDLIFLDIQMPNNELDGIDFLNIMGNKYNYIFTTAHPEYALKSYEYNALDYLHKPFSFERFANAVSKVYDRFVDKNSKTLKIKDSPSTEPKSTISSKFCGDSFCGRFGELCNDSYHQRQICYLTKRQGFGRKFAFGNVYAGASFLHNFIGKD